MKENLIKTKPLNDIKLFIWETEQTDERDNQMHRHLQENSSAIMTQFIVERALKLIGGESGDGPNGDALVAEYKSILSKRMGRWILNNYILLLMINYQWSYSEFLRR